MNQGRCSNAPSLCSKAQNFDLIDMPTADTKCPECGLSLLPASGGSGGSGALGGLDRRVVLGGAAAGALVLGAGLWHWLGHSGGGTGQGGGTSSLGTSSGTTPPADIKVNFAGSNTIGSSLGPALAKGFMEAKGYSNISIHKPKADAKDTEIVDVSGTSPEGKSTLFHFVVTGSGDAFKGLGAGTADIGMASRPIKPEEIGKLRDLGDMSSHACEKIIGLDGIAIIVNQANVVKQLTMDQLANIFSGRITDWAQVGGTSGPINLYSRKPPSGTLDFFKERVLNKGEVFSSAKFIEDSTELSGLVKNDPQGIGFIGMPYILTNRALDISNTGGVTARYVSPTEASVKSRIYPISRNLYLYQAANPKNPLVNDFMQFVLDPKGQELVAAEKFVRYDAAPPPPPPNSNEPSVEPGRDAPGEYRQLIAGASLIGNFHFRSNSSDLENSNIQTVETLPQILQLKNIKDSQLMLIGFSDGKGDAAYNLKLSYKRAAEVASILDTKGIKVGLSRGYGATNFVDGNDSEAGLAANRRVEIWVRK